MSLFAELPLRPLHARTGRMNVNNENFLTGHWAGGDALDASHVRALSQRNRRMISSLQSRSGGVCMVDAPAATLAGRVRQSAGVTRFWRLY